MAKAYVENYNGYPAIMIDGKPYPPMLATIYTRKNGEIVVNHDYYNQFGKAGVKVYFLICDTEWLVPDAFEKFVKEAEGVLAAVPDAYFMLRIGLHPPNEWIEKNPDECVNFSDGKKYPVELWTETYRTTLPQMYSLCSEKWREDAGKALVDTYKKLEEMPFFDRIIGFFLAAGGTSEWYYLGVNQMGAYCDTGEAFRRNFEEYLRKTYDIDENKLKKAWNDKDATFAHPHIPTLEERRFMWNIDGEIRVPPNRRPSDTVSEPPRAPEHLGIMLNLNHSRRIMDYYWAWSYGTARSVDYFAKLLKDCSNNEKLVGAFYGSCGCIDFLDSSTSSSSLLVLDGGNVDFFAAPGVYQNRQIGGFTGQREPIDSFRLRNTMFICEDDTRTHAENSYFGDLYETFSLEDTITIMKRDFGRDLCEDIQSWWFDQIDGGGRYNFKEVFELVSRQQQVAREAYEKDRIKHNEIAFIYDEESINMVSWKTNFESIEFMRDYEISRIGASCDMYYHNDMANPLMPSYKLYVFCNVFYLSDDERKAIKAKLKKDGAVALWFYAPGFANPDKKEIMSCENISELIGIDIGMRDNVVTPKFKITNRNHPLTKNLDFGQIYGFNYRYRQNNIMRNELDNTQLLYPAFYSIDKDAENLAFFLQEDKTLPAVTIKQADGWTSVFCGSRTLRCDFIREIARYAGCHIYCDTDDVIYASRNYITIHAASSGEKTLRFKEKCTPFEIYEKTDYGKDVTEITFKLLKDETKTFEIK